MASVILVLIDGFEEIEALTAVDVLRRGGVSVTTVSLSGEPIVTGSHDIPVTSDFLFEDADFSSGDMLVIPGGTKAFNDHEELKNEVLKYANAGKYVAAICAAPMVLGGLGLLKGKKATCYPSFEKYLDGAEIQDGAPVVVDGKIVTGRGPGLAMDFALTLLELLTSKDKRDEVAKQLLLI